MTVTVEGSRTVSTAVSTAVSSAVSSAAGTAVIGRTGEDLV